jgi:D-serine deaminase-like pyridoxal phosphate-dependent protein
MKRMMHFGIQNFKCATTLELSCLCDLGAADVLLAFPVVGANAERVAELAADWPHTRVSVLVENRDQIALWRGTKVDIFVDVNPGMNRTGIEPSRSHEILNLARVAGAKFRGLHYYDGHFGSTAPAERSQAAEIGYAEVLGLADRLKRDGLAVGELITSGTPVAPVGLSYAPFRQAGFVHRISPGTVVYNDTTSLDQLAAFPYEPAVLVLASVVSHPTPNIATCDAGHKAVSVDAGVPNCAVLGWPHLVPQKPSEEHLPLRADAGQSSPRVGEQLYLLPRHVCPTVNNFDEALMIRENRVQRTERVSARGHESPVLVRA